MSWLKKIISLLFPHICLLCEKPLPWEEEGPFCKECEKEVRYLAKEKVCKICGKPLSSGLCEDCRRRRNKFDFSRSVALYEGKWREIIHLFKYRGLFTLSSYLGEKLWEVYRNNPIYETADYIIPVPLTYWTRVKRGYHQTLLLANYLSRKTGKKVLRKVLYKSKNIPSQTGLSRKERLKNVRGAFQTRNSRIIKGKNILLIDDVLTTGATVNECVKILKKAGVKKVFVLTLARGE